MELQTHVKFKKPYFIEQLGEEGLTARDVAESLEIPIERVHAKVKNGFLDKLKHVQLWRVHENSMLINPTGYEENEIISYLFNTRAAKAFVATYNNEKGVQYLDFLFNCETVVTEVLPKLKAELEDLREQLIAHEKSYVEKQTKRLKGAKKGKLVVPVYKNTLFGLTVEHEYRNMSELSALQKLKGIDLHLAKVQKGLCDRMLHLREEIEKEELDLMNKRIGEVLQ